MCTNLIIPIQQRNTTPVVFLVSSPHYFAKYNIYFIISSPITGCKTLLEKESRLRTLSRNSKAASKSGFAGERGYSR